VPQGNWSWRVTEGSWTEQLAARAAAIVDVTDRDNDPLGSKDSESGETKV
jgi:4-alpha-glucanotransferase